MKLIAVKGIRFSWACPPPVSVKLASLKVTGVPALDVDGTLVSAFLPLDDLRQLAAL